MEFSTTIGVDMSDKKSKICVMTKEGGGRRIFVEMTYPNTKEGFSECFAKFDRSWPETISGAMTGMEAYHITRNGSPQTPSYTNMFRQ